MSATGSVAECPLLKLSQPKPDNLQPAQVCQSVTLPHLGRCSSATARLEADIGGAERKGSNVRHVFDYGCTRFVVAETRTARLLIFPQPYSAQISFHDGRVMGDEHVRRRRSAHIANDI